MLTLKKLIVRQTDRDSEFRYYIPIIEKAEKNEIEHPDIAIECCASLFQGVSKSIVHRLDGNFDREKLEKLSVQQQVKAALMCLKENDDVLEDEFPRAVENLVRITGALRNSRGDISHGRAVPKELQSDRSLARIVLDTSEAVLRYMLASYFALEAEENEFIPYEESPEFNVTLDAENPLHGKPLYSRALYDQYYDDYRIQLGDYLDLLAVADDEGAGA